MKVFFAAIVFALLLSGCLGGQAIPSPASGAPTATPATTPSPQAEEPSFLPPEVKQAMSEDDGLSESGSDLDALD